jgi:hypothetical protein
MGGTSDLLIDVEDAVNEIHSRDPRPSYKQAIQELKKETFSSSKTGKSVTLGKEARDYMEAVLESKGHAWAEDWTDDEGEEAEGEGEEEAEDDEEAPAKAGTSGGSLRAGVSASMTCVSTACADNKRPRLEDASKDEPIGVTRQRQLNATHDAEMRAVLPHIGGAIHEAMSGCTHGAQLQVKDVSSGAWNALIAHFMGPAACDQGIELERDELLESFDKAQLEAPHCIPGTSNRYICKRAAFDWEAEAPRNLPIEKALSYGSEPEHVGRLTISLKVKIRKESR